MNDNGEMAVQAIKRVELNSLPNIATDSCTNATSTAKEKTTLVLALQIDKVITEAMPYRARMNATNSATSSLSMKHQG